MGGRSGGRGVEVYLEVGTKKVFAGALEWPGWCRSGRDEPSALAALLAYAPRYHQVIRSARLGFVPVTQAADLVVVERLKGDATTDFGAPGGVPKTDSRALAEADVLRHQKILDSCWETLDRAVEAAKGLDLRKGPRGGGRELEAIVVHVLEADTAYLERAGWKVPASREENLSRDLRRMRESTRDALRAAASGRIAPLGPRGGRRWSGRTLVRRMAWHTLDHAWEIEDRIP